MAHAGGSEGALAVVNPVHSARAIRIAEMRTYDGRQLPGAVTVSMLNVDETGQPKESGELRSTSQLQPPRCDTNESTSLDVVSMPCLKSKS